MVYILKAITGLTKPQGNYSSDAYHLPPQNTGQDYVPSLRSLYLLYPRVITQCHQFTSHTFLKCLKYLYLQIILNSKRNVKNDFILIYFEKGAWYMLIMNKFIKSNLLQNLNKILIFINTMKAAKIQVFTMLQ